MMGHAPLVYFIGSNEYVKIGTTTDLSGRFRTIANGLPFEVDLFGVLNGGEKEENAVQRKFRHLHTRLEWFVFHQDIRDFVQNNCHIIPFRRARDYSPTFDGGYAPNGHAAKLDWLKIQACREGRRLEINDHMKTLLA